MKKIALISIIWIAVLSFIVMNFNIYMLLGFLVGVLYRAYHGSAISLALGMTIGIMVVELCKFITYRM